MRKYDLRRTISFHGRVKAASEFSAEMPNVIPWMPAHARPTGPIWSEHVSGEMTSGHRDRLLLRFRDLAPDERGLLSNARCLGEGVDVPSVDGIAFIDPRRSTIDIVQALGRAIRKSAEKRVGTIVLPVFLTANEDPDEVLNESVFQHVWDVLKALRAHDETLGEELDELRRRLGARRGAPRRPAKIKLDVPRRVGADFARAFDVRLVEQTTASWEFYFGLLQSFVEQEGHSRVPGDYRVDDGTRLGVWVSHQRQGYRQRSLGEERRSRLEAVPGWSWGTHDDAWEDGFNRLQSYLEREGNSRVRWGYRDGDGYRLGEWVSHQRRDHNEGTLGEERRHRLDALLGWTWKAFQDDWDDRFERLQSYVRQKGDSQVPKDYQDDDGTQLGQWVVHQRQAYRRGTLGEERRRRLESLPGWIWGGMHDDAWEAGFDRLERYVEREGNSRVPDTYRDVDGFSLGKWVRNQRTRYQKGTLGEERRSRLEAVPGWTWSIFGAGWEDWFERLQSYVKREGNSRVPNRYRDGDGLQLGNWVQNRRKEYQEGTLDEERRDQLEALPGWTWNALEDAWEEGFSRLQGYIQLEGHSRVPAQLVEDDGFRLGRWVHRQRQGYRRRTLAQERVRRLEALPGWGWRAV
jgi:hypothetical protein